MKKIIFNILDKTVDWIVYIFIFGVAIGGLIALFNYIYSAIQKNY